MALAQTSRDALELAAYSDADFAADMTDRKLLTGGVVLLNGMEVAWSAKVQCGLLLSNMEAEFVAASEVARVIIGLRQVLVEMCMGMAPFVPILTHVDNQAAISQINGEASTSKAHLLAAQVCPEIRLLRHRSIIARAEGDYSR